MNTIGCAKMTAGQIIDMVGFVMKMSEWDSMTADEKMQRTLDVTRKVCKLSNKGTSFFCVRIQWIYMNNSGLRIWLRRKKDGSYDGHYWNVQIMMIGQKQRLSTRTGLDCSFRNNQTACWQLWR